MVSRTVEGLVEIAVLDIEETCRVDLESARRVCAAGLPLDVGEDCLLAFDATRSELTKALGEPHHHERDPMQVPEPRAMWAFAASCGLRLFVDAEDSRVPGTDVMVHASDQDPEHALVHLGLFPHNPLVNPQIEPISGPATILWRQDETATGLSLGGG